MTPHGYDATAAAGSGKTSGHVVGGVAAGLGFRGIILYWETQQPGRHMDQTSGALCLCE